MLEIKLGLAEHRFDTDEARKKGFGTQNVETGLILLGNRLVIESSLRGGKVMRGALVTPTR